MPIFTTTRSPGQLVLIHMLPSSEPAPILRCLSKEGILIKVMKLRPNRVRLDVRLPPGWKLGCCGGSFCSVTSEA